MLIYISLETYVLLFVARQIYQAIMLPMRTVVVLFWITMAATAHDAHPLCVSVHTDSEPNYELSFCAHSQHGTSHPCRKILYRLSSQNRMISCILKEPKICGERNCYQFLAQECLSKAVINLLSVVELGTGLTQSQNNSYIWA